MFRRIALGILLSVLLALPVKAQDFKKGFDAAIRGDFDAALEIWRPLAEKGDVDAQYNLGFMYANGYGVPQDYSQARKWFAKPIAQGHPSAQFMLGLMYANGRGVKQNDGEAVKWYRKAANQGNGDAQNNLGFMYFSGRGVKQDREQALIWYREAALRGSLEASQNLRSMGAGEKKTETKAPKPEAAHGAPTSHVSAWDGPAQPRLNITASNAAAEKPPKSVIGKPMQALGSARKGLWVGDKTKSPKKHEKILKTFDTVPANIDKKPIRTFQRGFRIQLAAIKSKNKGPAVKEAERLTRAFKPVLGKFTVKPVRADLGKRGIFYRLQAGPLAEYSNAELLCRKLAALKQACIVIGP